MRNIEEIRQKAEAFTAGFGPVYPLPVADVAGYKDFRVMVFTPNFDDDTHKVSGMIDYAKQIISVNEFDNEYEKRFTIAHELGHYALHSQNATNTFRIDFRDRENENKDRPKELEADMFAYELLMPVQEFAKYYEQYKDGIYGLVLKFGVSIFAVKRRIASLKDEGILT